MSKIQLEYQCSECGCIFWLKKKLNPLHHPPQCKSCRKTARKIRVKEAKYWLNDNYKEKRRNWYLANHYNMSQEDYNRLAELQGNVCAICKKEDQLVIDHDHLTGKIRGLLCQTCNRALGSLKENFTTLRSAAAYLLRHDTVRSWDKYFIEFARLSSTRSKDPSSQVGAVIVREKTILSTGYNGLPRGVNDTIIERYERPLKYSWMVHAEENSLLNAARNGIRCNGASLYVTPFQPCSRCATSIVQAGIAEVVVDFQFSNPRYAEDFAIANSVFLAAGIIVRPPE